MKKLLSVLILTLIPFSAYGNLERPKPLSKADRQEIAKHILEQQEKVVELQLDTANLKIYLDGELVDKLPSPEVADIEGFELDKITGKVIVLKFVKKK